MAASQLRLAPTFSQSHPNTVLECRNQNWIKWKETFKTMRGLNEVIIDHDVTYAGNPSQISTPLLELYHYFYQ